MRVNRGTLLKIANDTVSQRARQDRGIISAYMCGSVLGDDYLLGGTTDIDLTFIHVDAIAEEREIVRLTDEIHLDIAHYAQRDFLQTRELRIHPWLGPTISGCDILYDPQHFMDFTQASVRGQFNRSDYILERAQGQAERARQVWMAFYTDTPNEPGPPEMVVYLQAAGQAANAIASLNGSPLTERRMLLRFPERAEMVDRPGLQPGLLGLLGAPNVEASTIKDWLADWQAAYGAVPAELVPSRLHPDRKFYYLRAFEALLEGDQPHAVLWPLLRTWSQAAVLLTPEDEALVAWREAFLQLGLLGAGFAVRVEALDAYLDMVEETLDDWRKKYAV
jgi:hypothetical protein